MNQYKYNIGWYPQKSDKKTGIDQIADKDQLELWTSLQSKWSLKEIINKIDKSELKIDINNGNNNDSDSGNDSESNNILEQTDELNQYTIFPKKEFLIKNKLLWINTTIISPFIDRSVGCLVGMVLGDAFGSPFDGITNDYINKSIKYKPKFDYINKKYYNERNINDLKRGQWTNISSLAMCICDTLIINGKLNKNDIKNRILNWYYKGYNNAFKKERDRFKSIGAKNCVLNMINGTQVKPELLNDNDSVTRVAPIPIFWHTNSDKARKMAMESSLITHNSYICAEACAFISFIIIHAIYTQSFGNEKAKMDGLYIYYTIYIGYNIYHLIS